MGDLELRPGKARLGSHGGNAFAVALRDVKGSVHESLEELRSRGAPQISKEILKSSMLYQINDSQ